MKGFTRKLDSLGRICIPSELRKNYNINEEVEFITTQSGITIRAVEKKEQPETDIAVVLDMIESEIEKLKSTNPSICTGLKMAKKMLEGEY